MANSKADLPVEVAAAIGYISTLLAPGGPREIGARTTDRLADEWDKVRRHYGWGD